MRESSKRIWKDPTGRVCTHLENDRACLTLARRLSLPALKTDRVWENRQDLVGVPVKSIR